MNCTNCGSVVNPGDSVCMNCGAPIGGNGGMPMNNGGMMPQNNIPPQMNSNMNNGMNGGMMSQNNMPPQMNPNMNNGMNGGMMPQNGMPPQMDPNMNNGMNGGMMPQNGMPPQMDPNMNNGMNGGMMPQNGMPPQMNQNMNNGMMNNMGLPTGPDDSVSNNGKSKKKVSPLLIFLIIVLIGVLAYAGPYWYKQWFGEDKNGSGTESENNGVSEEPSIVLNNYTFTIPSGFEGNLGDNKVIFNNSEYVIFVTPIHVKYDDLKANVSDLKDVVKSLGITFEEKDDYSVSNEEIEYLVFDGKYQDKDINYFYTRLGDNDSLEGIIFKNAESFDNVYSSINSMVSNVSISENGEEAVYSKENLGVKNIDVSLVNDSFSNNSSENETVDTPTETEETE